VRLSCKSPWKKKEKRRKKKLQTGISVGAFWTSQQYIDGPTNCNPLRNKPNYTVYLSLSDCKHITQDTFVLEGIKTAFPFLNCEEWNVMWLKHFLIVHLKNYLICVTHKHTFLCQRARRIERWRKTLPYNIVP